MAAADRGLLRNRAFLAIWGAQILSQVAANAVTSALIILVAEITHPNTSSSFLILLAVLPAILFGIAAGAIADRGQPVRLRDPLGDHRVHVRSGVDPVRDPTESGPGEGASLAPRRGDGRRPDRDRDHRGVPLSPSGTDRHVVPHLHRAHVHAG